MGRPGYPAESRQKVLDLLAEGTGVSSIAVNACGVVVAQC